MPMQPSPSADTSKPWLPKLLLPIIDSEWQNEGAVFAQREARVVGDLPEVAIEVGEVPGVATVEGLGGGLGDRRPGRDGRREHLVDLLPRAHVLRQRDAAEAICARVLAPGVVGQLLPPPEDDRRPTGLHEDRLLDFFALPPERLVEAPRG